MVFDFGLMLLQKVFIGNFALCINLVINVIRIASRIFESAHFKGFS